MIYHIRRMMGLDATQANFEGFLSPLGFIKDLPNLFLAISILSLLGWLFVIINPFSRPVRIFHFLLLLSLGFIEYSYGKIDHYTHIWFYCGFVLIFLGNSSDHDKNKTILKSCQYLTLSLYAISGVWKLVYLFKGLQNYSFSELAREPLATSLVAGIVQNNSAANMLFNLQGVAIVGFVLVLIFQLLNFSLLFTPRFLLPLGYAAILFHILNGFIMNLFFLPTILCLLLFFPFAKALENEKLEKNLGI